LLQCISPLLAQSGHARFTIFAAQMDRSNPIPLVANPCCNRKPKSRSLSLGKAMRRRDFIKVIAGSAAAWPLPARAQQAAMPVIGYLGTGSAQSDAFRVTGFRQGLKEAGYVEGQNLTIEYRWAEDHLDRLPAMAADLVRHQVALIVAISAAASLAAKAATTTLPIVFETAGDPVKLGLAGSLSRPGGNLTGVTQLGEEATPKRLELLHELLPTARVMALLVNPAEPLTESQVHVSSAAAKTLGLELNVLNASTERDFDAAFAKLAELRAGGLTIAGASVFTSHIAQLAALTVRHRIPAVYQRREFAAAGGLVSYGTNIADTHRLVGIYTGRVLKGEKPADLPVQQATKVELYINLKTAKALGITVPLPLSGRADELIE
jgi:putative ABC transport system substrate-binding protein